MKPKYIGDGVYVECDMFHVILKANDNINPTDTIYLEDSVAKELIKYIKEAFGWLEDEGNNG